MKTARTLTLQECLAVLRLPRNATLDDLKRAYRRRAFELHPDLNPDQKNAHLQFQLLNEAYVALSSMLKPAPPTREDRAAAQEKANRQQAARPQTEDTQTEAAGAAENAAGQQTTADKASTEGSSTADTHGGPAEEPQANAHATPEGDARQRQRAHAYERADVLRDLLNDPFARRVFADIYSELNKKEQAQAASQQETHKAEPRQEQRTAPPPPQQEKPAPQQTRPLPFDWMEQKLKSVKDVRDSVAEGGLKGVVSGWLRGQIDDAQRMCLPAAMLQSGRRIRLQIRRAFASEPCTIEITLPQNFTPGKSVRLRGMGKKIGPWQGDLYLTLESK